MRIITIQKINKFIELHSNADIPLKHWYFTTKNSQWSSVSDVKNTFNTVDYVGNNRFVFNIKGNHYRLVAIIIFASKKVYIRFIGTHKEYDKIDCKNI